MECSWAHGSLLGTFGGSGFRGLGFRVFGSLGVWRFRGLGVSEYVMVKIHHLSKVRSLQVLWLKLEHCSS